MKRWSEQPPTGDSVQGALDIVVILIWAAMMCWEVYDLHPDHVVAYSALLLGPLIYRISFRQVSSTHPTNQSRRTAP